MHKPWRWRWAQRPFKIIPIPGDSSNMSPPIGKLWRMENVPPTNYRHFKFGDQNGMFDWWISTIEWKVLSKADASPTRVSHTVRYHRYFQLLSHANMSKISEMCLKPVHYIFHRFWSVFRVFVVVYICWQNETKITKTSSKTGTLRFQLHLINFCQFLSCLALFPPKISSNHLFPLNWKSAVEGWR